MAIRFEICSSDHDMRSHVPAFLVSESEKKNILKFTNVIESDSKLQERNCTMTSNTFKSGRSMPWIYAPHYVLNSQNSILNQNCECHLTNWSITSSLTLRSSNRSCVFRELQFHFLYVCRVYLCLLSFNFVLPLAVINQLTPLYSCQGWVSSRKKHIPFPWVEEARNIYIQLY